MNELIAFDENNCPVIPTEVIANIVELERDLKDLENQEKTLRQALLDAMCEHGIVNISTDDITISYVAESERESFDTKAFKEDFEKLYSEYSKKQKVNHTVQIKLKGKAVIK